MTSPTRLRDRIAAARDAREVAVLRAGAVRDAYAARRAADPQVTPAAGTGADTVRFSHVGLIEGGVEVWLGEHTGPPDYRIFNPPTLVRDPLGDVAIGRVRFREDPLAALAEVIAGHGQQEKKRSIR